MTVKNCLILLVSLIALVGCDDFPKTELCIATNEGDLACDDPRKEPSTYFRYLKPKDICTNREDYFTLERYVKDLQKRVKKGK